MSRYLRNITEHTCSDTYTLIFMADLFTIMNIPQSGNNSNVYQ